METEQLLRPGNIEAALLKPGDLVDEKEVAAILDVAVQTLRNWRWRGEGPPYVKIGKRLVRYYRPGLATHIEVGNGEEAA